MSIPPSAARYFWGDNLQTLSLDDHSRYIAQTLLEKGDIDALQWLFSVLPTLVIKTMLPTLKLSKRSAHFWEVYLS